MKAALHRPRRRPSRGRPGRPPHRPARGCAAALALAAALACTPARAQADDDAAALQLADRTEAPVAQARPWRAFAEAALGRSWRRDAGTETARRLSLDLHVDATLAPGWRAFLSDRFDADSPPQAGHGHSINTWREGYLSWQPRADRMLDAGRINVRNGVATAFNPTDWFKAGALRSVVSVDPAALKENRQGSVMLRGQQLWSGGSLTALYAPRLSRQRSSAAFDPDWAATNGLDRWLLAASLKWSDELNPQWLLFKAAGAEPQLGFNLAALLGDATVLNLEWSGGRSASQWTRALQRQGLPAQDDTAWRQRAAIGLTYTTADKLSLTAELDHDGSAMDRRQWDALRAGPLPLFQLYAAQALAEQALPTHRAAFVHASWQDALLPRLDLSGLLRRDQVDHSRMAWLQARYRTLGRSEWALQWQRSSGAPLSTYGALPVRQGVLLSLRLYL